MTTDERSYFSGIKIRKISLFCKDWNRRHATPGVYLPENRVKFCGDDFVIGFADRFIAFEGDSISSNKIKKFYKIAGLDEREKETSQIQDELMVQVNPILLSQISSPSYIKDILILSPGYYVNNFHPIEGSVLKMQQTAYINLTWSVKLIENFGNFGNFGNFKNFKKLNIYLKTKFYYRYNLGQGIAINSSIYLKNKSSSSNFNETIYFDDPAPDNNNNLLANSFNEIINPNYKIQEISENHENSKNSNSKTNIHDFFYWKVSTFELKDLQSLHYFTDKLQDGSKEVHVSVSLKCFKDKFWKCGMELSEMVVCGE